MDTKAWWRGSLLAGGILAAAAAIAWWLMRGREHRHIAVRRPTTGELKGRLYHLMRRHPDPDVGDDVLADRIRSALGPVEKRLDIPRVHVMVNGHIAILHGEVTSREDAATLEHAVLSISGVRGVQSHLKVGLPPGATRPSQGRRRDVSTA